MGGGRAAGTITNKQRTNCCLFYALSDVAVFFIKRDSPKYHEINPKIGQYIYYRGAMGSLIICYKIRTKYYG